MIITPTRIAAWYNSHLAPKFHPKLHSCPRPNGKPSRSRLFDQTLESRLRSLAPIPDPSPSIPLLWLATLFDLVADTIVAAAAALIADPSVASADSDALFAYLDAGVPFLDACNAVSGEIARLQRRLLPLRLALHHITSGDVQSRRPSPEKLRRARDAIEEWRTLPCREIGAAAAGPVMKLKAKEPPRGEISVVARATYAVEMVSGLAAAVAVTALGSGEGSGVERFRTWSEWPWAEAMDGVVKAVSGRVGAEVGGEVEAAVERMTAVMEGEAGEGLESVVAEVVEAARALTEGLDGLSESVTSAFRAAIGIRNTALDKLKNC